MSGPSEIATHVDQPVQEIQSKGRRPLDRNTLPAVLAIVVSTSFIVYFCNAIGNAFLPQHLGLVLHIPTATIGVIYAASPIGQALSSLLCFWISRRVGRFSALVAGLVIASCGKFAFIFSSTVSGFFFASFLQGFGSGLSQVSASSLLVSNIENLDDTVSLKEFLGGVGFSIGGIIGGLLFQYYGFSTVYAFAFIFEILITLSLLAYRALSRNMKEFVSFEVSGSVSSQSLNIFQTYSSILTPAMTTCCGVYFSSVFVLSGIIPILAPHISALFTVPQSVIGTIIGVPGLVITLNSAFASTIVKKLGPKSTTMYAQVLIVISVLFLGPSPFLNPFLFSLKMEQVLVILSLVGIGTGVGISVVPIYGVMRDLADRMSLHADITTGEVASSISSLITFSIAAGSIFGPLVSGSLMDIVPKQMTKFCGGLDNECVSGFAWTSFTLCVISMISPIAFGYFVPRLRISGQQTSYEVVEEAREL